MLVVASTTCACQPAAPARLLLVFPYSNVAVPPEIVGDKPKAVASTKELYPLPAVLYRNCNLYVGCQLVTVTFS